MDDKFLISKDIIDLLKKLQFEPLKLKHVEHDGVILDVVISPIYMVTEQTPETANVLGEYDDLENAVERANEGGYHRADYFNEISMKFKVEFYDGEYLSDEEIYDEYDMQNELNVDGKNREFEILLNIENPIYIKEFENSERKSEMLINQLKDELPDILNDKIFDIRGNKFKLYPGETLSKYNDIAVYMIGDDKVEAYVTTIKLRISDHTYNPSNNINDKYFLSIVITDDDKTSDRFKVRNQISFDGSDDLQTIVDGILDKLEDILYDISDKEL